MQIATTIESLRQAGEPNSVRLLVLEGVVSCWRLKQSDAAEDALAGVVHSADYATSCEAWLRAPFSVAVSDLAGPAIFSLPTADPLIEGALWNNGGAVNISAGEPP